MKKISYMLTISMICAILAAFSNVISPLPWIMLVLGIIGAIFALISFIQIIMIRKKERNKEIDKAFELSMLAVALNFVVILIFLLFMLYFCITFVHYL